MVTGLLAALAAAASTNVFSMEEQRGAIPGGIPRPTPRRLKSKIRQVLEA